MRNPRKEVGRKFNELVDYEQIVNVPGGAGAGTVTSVDMTVPTGLTISGNPITNSGTLALTLTSGYLIPTTASKTDWDSAFNDKIVSAAVTGTTTKTLTLTQQDAGTITASWTDATGSGTVTSVAMTVPTGLSIAGSPITISGTLALTLTAGYSIPTTASQTTWDTAYTNRITSLTVTGSSGAATLVSNVLNIPTYTLAGLGGFANPMTTLGDSIYGAASGTPTRLAGNTTAVKQYLSQTGTGTVSAAPSWAAIAGADVTGAALTKTDDTNVTLTLGGTPTTALLRAASITVGWSGTLADARIASAATWNAKENALTFSTPLSRATNTISIPVATSLANGYLSSTDWSTFNGKQATITLTVTGSSGASTFVANTLNIPTYTLTGLGGQPLATNLTSLAALTYASTSFVKMTAAGTFTLDTSTYLTANQSITLSGDVSGTGTTAITTAIGTNKVTNAMLAQVATGTFHGRVTAATGNVETLTGTQATTLLDLFSSTLKGLVPLSGGGTANFLRADGTWAAPSGTGFTNPMTILGDSIYGGASGAATRLAGNITTAKQYLSQTGTGTVSAAPVWATIAGADITGAALTKVDDTNITLTLGGTSTTALLRAASITVGWTGTLADARIASSATWNSKFTLPTLTSGSVLFSNGTTIAQNNANFFWDNTNNRLGIGTTTPLNNLDVVRGTAGTMARGFYESGSVSYNADTKFGIYTASATATDGAALYLGQTNLLNSSSQYGGFELQYRYNSSTTEYFRINYVSRLATGAVSTSLENILLLSKTGQLKLGSYNFSSSFSGTVEGYLAFDTNGNIITTSGGTNLYNSNGTLTSTRVISGGGFSLSFEDNKATGLAEFEISNTTVSTGATNLLVTSDSLSGYTRLIKYSSGAGSSAILQANDTGLINYTAGNLVLLNTVTAGNILFGVGTGTSPSMVITTDGHVLINTTTNGTYFLDVNGDVNVTGKVNIAAGTATRAPIDFTPGSAALKTTPLAGDMEVDINGFLFYTQAARRGVIAPVQWICNTAVKNYTATNTSQNMFDAGSANAITFTASTDTYFFEAYITLSSLSATANSVGFGFSLSTAVVSSINYSAIASKVTAISTPTAPTQCQITTAAITAVTASNTSTAAVIQITGVVRFSTGGSVTPIISQIGATSASVLGIGSYVKFYAVGTSTSSFASTLSGWA